MVPVVAALVGTEVVAPVVTIGGLLSGPPRLWLFRRDIEWRIVRWYLPGAVAGGFLGGFVFATLEVRWLQLVIGLFLLSTVVQRGLGSSERTFPMRTPAFLPLGFVVSLASGVSARSDLCSTRST